MNVVFTFENGLIESGCDGVHQIKFIGKRIEFYSKEGECIAFFNDGLDSITEAEATK